MLEIDCDLKKLYFLNHSLQEPWHHIYIVLYILLTATSFISNVMLVIAIQRFGNKRMRKQNRLSSRNLLIRPLKPVEITRDRLIFHLAIHGILLSFTMPLTAFDGLSKFWPLGKTTEFLCQATKSSPSIVVYSTSMLIIVIALNCYRQIVIPHKMQLHPDHLKYITSGIIFLATLLSIPQVYHTKLFYMSGNNETRASADDRRQMTLNSSYLNTNTMVLLENTSLDKLEMDADSQEEQVDTCNEYDQFGWSHVVFCIEDWPFGEEYLDPKGRLNYSMFTFAIQLLLPLIIISYCYVSVYRTLQYHSQMRRTILNFEREEKLQKENRRSNRRNTQIAVISLVYLILWLPLGTINLLLDSYPDVLGNDMSHVTMVVLMCHLIGMSSAIANPIIYGYTNKHIRQGN